MSNYWSVSLQDYLAPNGTLSPLSPRGPQIAKYLAEIEGE
jgi:hypothetical protein